MTQNTRTLSYLINNDWKIGQGRADISLPYNYTDSPNTAKVFDYNGMKILFRGNDFTLFQSEYPYYFAMTGNFFGDQAYFTTTIPDQLNIRSVDSNGSIIIAVGTEGKISRSTDGGRNWTNIPSGVNKALTVVKYNPFSGQWIIPVGINSCLINSNGQANTFTLTTTPGLSIDLTTYPGCLRFECDHATGNMVICTRDRTYSSTDGINWLEVLVGVGGLRRLTYANGFFVVVYYKEDNTLSFAYCGADPNFWTLSTVNLPFTPVGDFTADDGYGMIYDGYRWLWSHCTIKQNEYISPYPTSGPKPPFNHYLVPVTQHNTLFYTEDESPASTPTIITYTNGGYYFSDWKNFKNNVGNTQFWYAPGFTKSFVLGPSSYCFPNSDDSKNKYVSYSFTETSTNTAYSNTSITCSDITQFFNDFKNNGLPSPNFSAGPIFNSIVSSYTTWRSFLFRRTMGITKDGVHYFINPGNNFFNITPPINDFSIVIPKVTKADAESGSNFITTIPYIRVG